MAQVIPFPKQDPPVHEYIHRDVAINISNQGDVHGYIFSLNKITNGLLSAVVFGDALTEEEALAKAKRRIDNMIEAFNGPSTHVTHDSTDDCA